MRNFKQLEVWKDARALAKHVYLLTDQLPDNEKYGLTSQVRRCTISIAANIAEGPAKSSSKDFTRFLEISQGSCFELESHLILANDLGILSISDTEPCLQNIVLLQKRLYNLIKYTRNAA